MFSPDEVLLEHGLVGAFDTMVMMHDEEIAIIIADNGNASNSPEETIGDGNADSRGFDHLKMNEGGVATYNEVTQAGVTYLELQMSSQALAAQLYYRLGVRRGDPVAIICHGHAAAEITACLACARIGAPFVPIDSTWITTRTGNGDKLAAIVNDAKPVAAVVVADNDNDYAVIALASLSLHRCALICQDGSAVLSESNITDTPDEIPSIYPDTESDKDDEDDKKLHDRNVQLPPLYIMYTSGSTGTPKGVLGTHEGLINRLVWQYKRFPYAVRTVTFNDNSSDSSGSDKELDADFEDDSENNSNDRLETKDEYSTSRMVNINFDIQGIENKKEDEREGEVDMEKSNEETLENASYLEDIDNENELSIADSTRRRTRTRKSIGDLGPRFLTPVLFKGEVVCKRTPLTFVDSMAEIFAPLLAGVPLWAPPPNVIKERGVAGIAFAAATAGVTRLTLLPSQLSSVITMMPDLATVWPSLSLVIVSGEDCNSSLATRFETTLKGASLVNIYGSTEIGADVCYVVLCQPTFDAEDMLIGKDGQDGTDKIEESNDIKKVSRGENDEKIKRMESPGTKIDNSNDRTNIITSHHVEEGDYVCDSSLTAQTFYSDANFQAGTNRFVGKSPIGYAIDGNELFVVRSLKIVKDMDSCETLYDIKKTGGKAGEDRKEYIVKNECNELEEFELLPDGVPGELLVGGSQLAMGYHNRLHETNCRFISRSSIRGVDGSISSTGQRVDADLRRVFRTGDIVVRVPLVPSSSSSSFSSQRHLPSSAITSAQDSNIPSKGDNEVEDDKVKGENRGRGSGINENGGATSYNDSSSDFCSKWPGSLVWLGRKDLQVKVRGVRVELEEVERVLSNVLQEIVDHEKCRNLERVRQRCRDQGGENADNDCVEEEGEDRAKEGREKQSAYHINPYIKDRKIKETINCKKINIREGMAVVAISDETNRGSNQLILFLEIHLKVAIQMYNSTEILKCFTRTCASTYVPLLILFTDTLPKTTTGKLDRPHLNRIAKRALEYGSGDSEIGIDVGIGVGVGIGIDVGILTSAPLRFDNATSYKNADIDDDIDGFDSCRMNLNISGTEEDDDRLDSSSYSVCGSCSICELSDEFQIWRALTKGIIDVYKSVLPQSVLSHKIAVATTTTLSTTNTLYATPEASDTEKRKEEKIIKIDNDINKNKNEIKESGVDDLSVWGGVDFYSLGGDSLRAVEAVWRLGCSLRGLYESRHGGGVLWGSEGCGTGSNTGSVTGSKSVVRKCLGTGKGAGSEHDITRVKVDAELQKAISLLEVSDLKLTVQCLAKKIYNDFVSITTLGDKKKEGETACSKRNFSTHLENDEDDGLNKNIKLFHNGHNNDKNTIDEAHTENSSVNNKNMKGVYNIEIGLQGGRRLSKVSVHGRNNMWEWHPVLGNEERSERRGKGTARNEEVEREDLHTCSAESYKLYPSWSSTMAKCVDSSPLVIVRSYHNTKASSVTAAPTHNRIDKETSTWRQVEVDDEAKGEAGLLFIGSHGGDFTAVDTLSGRKVWTLDLNSEWRGPGRVHVEGSALCDLKGDVVYVGCFRGDDVDGSVVKEEVVDEEEKKEEKKEEDEEEEEEEDETHRQKQKQKIKLKLKQTGNQEEDPPVERKEQIQSGLGKVFAIRALTGQVLWSVPIGGEIKGTIAVDHRRQWLLVGSYDGYLYVISQECGVIISRVPCGGSIYSSPIITEVTVSINLSEKTNLMSNNESIDSLYSCKLAMSVESDDLAHEEYNMKSETFVGIDIASVTGIKRNSEGFGREEEGVKRKQEEKQGELNEGISLVSTIAYICTTQGKLLAISLPLCTSDTCKQKTENEATSLSVRDVAVQVLWTYSVEAPIFSTPLVSSTVTTAAERTVRTAQTAQKEEVAKKNEQGNSVSTATLDVCESIGAVPSDDSLLESQFSLLRTDTVIIGVVDSTVRCLSVRFHIPIEDISIRALVDLRDIAREKSDKKGVARSIIQEEGRGDGEELWRVSFASKPVFSSICSLYDHPVKKHFSFILSASPSTMLSIPSSTDKVCRQDLFISMPLFLTSNDAKECSAERQVIIFGSHDGHIRGITSCGVLLWETDLGSVLFSSPCVVVGTSLVIAATTAGNIYLVDCGSSNSSSFGVDSDSSSKRRRYSDMRTIESNGDANLRSDESDIDRYRPPVNNQPLGSIVAHTRLCGEIYSSPVMCGNMLYIGCRDDKVHAIEIEYTKTFRQ